MNYLLDKLSAEELEELFMMPVWVVILIAGSDNVFSKKEIKKAVGYVKQQEQQSDGFLKDYYKTVAAKFEVNLKGYIALLPRELEKRNRFLVDKLSGANRLFSKIDVQYASALYSSYRGLAHRVGTTTGGLFGLLSISFAESTYIDLKMINNPQKAKTEN